MPISSVAMDVGALPVLGHARELEPERRGLHAAMEGEEEHHGKTPVLKKVKEKVKKIKDTISKKKHGHGDGNHDEDHDVSEEEESYEEDDEERLGDPAVHGATGHAGGEKAIDVEKAPLKDYVRSLEEDPAAPMSETCAQRGGEEIGTSPVIQAFEAMTVTDQPPVKKEASGVHNMSEEEKPPSCTDKITTTTAKEAPYETVAEAGAGVIEKVQQGGSAAEGGSARVGSGVRVKLAEKLKPGEEDKALCEVVSDAIRKRREAVAVTDSNAKSGKVGMMGRLRGAVTSWVGGGRESHTSPSIEHQRKETEGERPEEEIHKQELLEGTE